MICIGLDTLIEKDFVHQFLTPDCIFLDSNGWIKIADFGHAKILKILKSEPRPNPNMRFRSPEQL